MLRREVWCWLVGLLLINVSQLLEQVRVVAEVYLLELEVACPWHHLALVQAQEA